MEIRRRLIEANAPQKGSSNRRKIRWPISTIQGILKAADEISTGIKVFTREGVRLEVPGALILDQDTDAAFRSVRQGNRKYPANHKKYSFFRSGLVTCEWGKSGAALNTAIPPFKT